LRALAVTGSTRSPVLPAVPTLAEAGLGGYNLESWFAVYGPARMSEEAVTVLNRAFNEVLAMPEIRERLQQSGFTARGSSSRALGELTQREYDRLGALVRRAAVSAE
jgi:tripartite-type tricarboxylate transporter receptor subunit TctC